MARVCETSCGDGAADADADAAAADDASPAEEAEAETDGDGVRTARSAAISVCCSLSRAVCESRNACRRCANAAPAGDMTAAAAGAAEAEEEEAGADDGEAVAACVAEEAGEEVAGGGDDGFICVETWIGEGGSHRNMSAARYGRLPNKIQVPIADRAAVQRPWSALIEKTKLCCVFVRSVFEPLPLVFPNGGSEGADCLKACGGRRGVRE
jgi:hypothetical protein